MPRNRDFLKERSILVHVWNEGVDRGPIFQCTRDYLDFLERLLVVQQATGVHVLGYVLTPDRFDLIVHQHEPQSTALFMKRTCHSFSCMLNRRLKRRGHSFLGRYEGRTVADASEFLRLSHIFDTTPVDSGLAPTPAAWQYSSCLGYLGKSNSSVVDHALLWALLGGSENYGRFLEQFNPCDPGAADDFLCPESAKIWAKEGLRTHQRQKGPKIGRK